jgi:hypothetical protein
MREPVQETLALWLDLWRDLLLIKIGYNKDITNVDLEVKLVEMAKGFNLTKIRAFITSIQMAVEQLKQNANPRLTFDALMLNIPKQGGI